MHASITLERILEICDPFALNQYGVCLECGEETSSPVEPDARGYLCESCGKRAVAGPETLLFAVA